MKRLLFLLFVGLFPLNFIISNAAQYSMQSWNMHFTGRKVPLKGRGGRANQTTRTSVVYPVEASITVKVLTLDFLSKSSSVTVTVTNVETNDVIYHDIFFIYTGILSIDMSAEEVGNYKVELVSQDYELSGDFVLE